MYIRVKDPDTGHEFDLPEGSHLIRKGLVKPIKADRFPPSPVVRRPKHHIPKAPAVRPDQSASPSGAPQDATERTTS